jgi:hypothetical protein
VRQNGWEPFSGKLWQRNYYEHIIRNEDALCAIQWYIENNPIMWNQDRENPIAERLPPQRERNLLQQKYGFTKEALDFIMGTGAGEEEED